MRNSRVGTGHFQVRPLVVGLTLVVWVTTLGTLAPSAALAQVSSQDVLVFTATDNPLSATPPASENFIPLYNQVESRTEGEIMKVDLAGVPLAALQAAWDSAIASCDNSSYGQNVVILGVLVATPVSPTISQCINGATISYPVGVTTCGTAPFGYPCVDYNSVTITGSGPRPTTTSSEIYDAGAEFQVAAQAIIGFQFDVSQSNGTVDIDYATTADIQVIDEGSGIYSLVTSRTVDEDASGLTSEYADTVTVSLGLVVDLSVTGTLTACLPPDPCETDTVSEGASMNDNLVTLTSDSSNNGVQGILPTYVVTLLSEDIVTGLGQPYQDPLQFTFGAQTLIDLGLLPDKVEFPLGVPIPLIPGTAPPGIPSFGVSLTFADLGFYSPSFDLTDTFNCGTLFDPANPDPSGCIDSFSVDPAGALRRTQAPVPQARNLLGGPGLQGSIILAPDRYRADIDIDYLATGGLGLGVVLGPPGALMALDFGDLDLATIWGDQQALTFTPDLMVTFQFSEPTLVFTGSLYESVTSHTTLVGTTLSLQNPSPTMTITPVYSIAVNTFENLTESYVDFALESKLLAFETSGFILEQIGSLLGTDLTKAYAVVQGAVGFGSVTTNTLIDDSYPLTGFGALPGTPIQIGGSFDSDLDGLFDDEEAAQGTNPSLADTDGDSVGDYDEIFVTNTNPLVSNSFADLFVAERDFDTIVRVDLSGPSAGTRTLISGAGTGSGPALVNPIGIAVEPAGTLLAVLPSGSLLRIDPSTGNRTTVSSASVGSGTNFSVPVSVVLENGQTAIVADQGSPDRLFRVDLATGDRSVIATIGGGSAPVYIALEQSGTLLLAGQTDGQLRRFIFASDGTASEVALSAPVTYPDLVGVAVTPGGEIALAANGHVYLHDDQGHLLRSVITPQTNNRGILAPYRGGALFSSWDTSGPADAILLAHFGEASTSVITDGIAAPALGFPAGLALRSLVDTDSDGMGDVDELARGLDPTLADTDGDGLQDGAEFAVHLTDPKLADTDGDGASDGLEIARGSDPNDSNSTPDPPQVPVLGLLGQMLLWGTMVIAARRGLAKIQSKS